MKGSIALLISGLAAQQVAATWNRQASGYNTPQYNNNECSDKQSKGFDWSDLKDGQKDFDYGDFKFGGGWTCANSFGKRDHVTKRSFNSKCVKNTVTKEKPAKISCDDKKKDGFSVKEIDVSVDHDADLEFHYKMGDGSTCKQTQACSKSGTTVKNTQCGGAKSVEVHFKGSKGKEQKKSCEIGFHKIDFDCTPGKTYTPAPPLSSQPPKTSSASKSSSSAVKSSSSSVVKSSSSTLSTATKPATTSSSAASSSSYNTVSSSVPASSKPITSASNSTVSIPTPSAPGSSKPATSSAPGSSSVYTPISSVPTPSAPSSSSKPSSSAPGSSASSVASSSSAASSSEKPSSSAPASSKPATSAPGTSAGSSSAYTPVPTPGKPSTTPAGSTAASSSEKPSSSAPASSKPESVKPSSSAPETSKPSPSAPVYPPLSCPEVLPKCLNTWIEIDSKCKDNTDSKCYCKIPDFTKNVIDCVAARATPEDASKALQYFVGICAADVPKNPGIITDCPSDIPINVAPPAPVTSTKPATTGPAPTAPASSAPVSSKPVPSGSAPVPSAPGSSAPVPSGSAPSAPAPSAPAPSAPAPSAPAPSAPVPSIPCTTITIGTTSYTVPQIIFTTTTPEPQAPGAPAPTPGYEPIAIVPVASYPAEVPAQTTAVAPYPVPSGISTAVKPTGTGAVGTGAVVPTAVVNFPGAASNVRFEIPAAMAAVLALFAL